MSDPERIGRYVIEGAIGRGAMGVVYRAHDPDIERTVAIKLIRADLLDSEDQSDFLARFRREAQAAGRCVHPNVVAVYDYAVHEGNPFLVMEFVDGVALSRAREPVGKMDAKTAFGIMLQVLAGLGAAHAAGIIHRDIKPANIMLTRSGQAKLADFGISRVEGSGLTSHGLVVGTPSYMSPEQCRGDVLDARSDLFSVGAVLYELLTGAKPFAGRSPPEIYMKLLNEEPPDLAEARPDLPAPLRAVVTRSLAKLPDNRFASAEAMANALRAALADAGAVPESTVVLPGRTAAPVGGAAFDPEVIDTLERKLAEHVGPIARYLVQSAAKTSASVETLCASLAAKIERPADRSRFEQEVRRKVESTGASGVSGQSLLLPPAEFERLQTELARRLGPVAKVLIKRALPGAGSPGALWRSVATHIEDPDERAAFLKQAPP
ncbi:MAG TPA: serine/threonine-protein kinase [Acetobacteraceae bacterium]|nr:serine/threonine-protein kinase [Acetobacteraceae bacterium]